MNSKSKILIVAVIGIFISVIGLMSINTAQSTTCDDSQRPKYFDDCEFQNMFYQSLPDMPEDFFSLRNTFLYRYIKYTDKVLDKTYWIQPEWYPNYNSPGGGLEAIKAYNGRAITVWSAGVYPSDFFISTKPGRNITVYVWVSNIHHQVKYEGIHLQKAYPACDEFEDRGFNIGNSTTCQNVTYAMQNIDINISPDMFLLTPTWPSYTNEYRKIIQINVSISDSINEGRYVVGFNVKNPPEEFNEQYYSEYGFGYTGSIREFHVDQPAEYRLFIDVGE